jgi:hypothetical protein
MINFEICACFKFLIWFRLLSCVISLWGWQHVCPYLKEPISKWLFHILFWHTWTQKLLPKILCLFIFHSLSSYRCMMYVFASPLLEEQTCIVSISIGVFVQCFTCLLAFYQCFDLQGHNVLMLNVLLLGDIITYEVL